LARARMAPAFEVTTVDGKRVSMDDLQGKVVPLDFWAT
jgi:peroxiredoxin